MKVCYAQTLQYGGESVSVRYRDNAGQRITTVELPEITAFHKGKLFDFFAADFRFKRNKSDLILNSLFNRSVIGFESRVIA